MIFSVQSSLSHSMVLFLFFCLRRLIEWKEKRGKKKRKTKLLSSIEDTRPGWTRRTQKWLKEVSMSRLPYAFSCMARWSIFCCPSSCLCIARVCSYRRSLTVALSHTPPTWVKSTIATTEKSPPAFRGIVLKFALQPKFIGTNPACNKPLLGRSRGQKRVLSLIVSQIWQALE